MLRPCSPNIPPSYVKIKTEIEKTGESYGWGGAASTHYWVSPADKLIAMTLEQIMPYQWDAEFGVMKMIYDAVRK